MNDVDYNDAILRIPHLNLTNYLPKPPIEDILRETARQNEKISSVEYGLPNTNEETKKIVQYIGESWKGFCIIDIVDRGDQMIDYFSPNEINRKKILDMGVEFNEEGYAIYKPTDIGRQMPITVNYVYDIMNKPGRTRMSVLKAGRTIGYHSHIVKSEDRIKPKSLTGPTANISTIHIPLICDEKSTHTVSDTKHPRILGNEYTQHYDIGEVWLFNSLQHHKAENKSDKDRYHLLIYFDHMDSKIRPFIEKAIEEYKGPYIKC